MYSSYPSRPSPPFVPGLGDHGVCRLVPPRPRCKLVARLHSTRVSFPIDQPTTRTSLSRPRDAQTRLVTERDGPDLSWTGSLRVQTDYQLIPLPS